MADRDLQFISLSPIWFWRLMMMAMKERLCFVTFHFAFESRGNYLVSAHSYGPYHLRHNFTRFFISWFFLSQYHSHSHIIFATILQDFLFLENVSLSHICLLGDVREKVHATRKHGWKVQTGHWNCLWQLWYFSTFSVWDFGLLIHHSTGGSCDISINICLVEDCSNELCTLLISLVFFYNVGNCFRWCSVTFNSLNLIWFFGLGF